ncbi:MAG: hypothetical protein WAV00_07870, partial [Nocardioides sp.]
ARIAQILADVGDTDTLDLRRVKALLVLARPDVAADLIAAYRAWRDRPADPYTPSPDIPSSDMPEAVAPMEPEPERTGPRPDVDWSRMLPTVTVFVHCYSGVDSDGVARVGAGVR